MELLCQFYIWNVVMEIRNEAGKIVNGGRVRLCFLDRHTEKAVNAPAVLLDVLQPFF
jgi:acyl-CoA thioester hydrolase